MQVTGLLLGIFASFLAFVGGLVLLYVGFAVQSDDYDTLRTVVEFMDAIDWSEDFFDTYEPASGRVITGGFIALLAALSGFVGALLAKLKASVGMVVLFVTALLILIALFSGFIFSFYLILLAILTLVLFLAAGGLTLAGWLASRQER